MMHQEYLCRVKFRYRDWKAQETPSWARMRNW